MPTELTSARLFSYDDEDGTDGRTAIHESPSRGVLWVLRWAAALAVLFFSCGVLAEFAYCLAAEHTVVRAARAGALEATLPRATAISVNKSVAQRLAAYSSTRGQMRIVIQQNGKPILGRMKVQPGDRISVNVAVPGTAVLPRWLQRVKFWRGNPPIEATAERTMPGRLIVGGMLSGLSP
jgi:hypothetical protein